MVDTRRSLSDILTLFADNTAGDISAQDLRDSVVSVYGAGALFTGATKTASFTAAVGQIYPVNVSAATANIDVTFPSTPAAGDTFGFYVATTSTTAGSSGFAQAPYWGVEPLATTSINGTSFVQSTGDGVGKWGLMAQGELLIFRYDAVGSTWVVVQDGRTPYTTSLWLSTATDTSHAAGTYLNPTDESGAWSAFTDVCVQANLSSGIIDIKRSGRFELYLFFKSVASITDGEYGGAILTKNTVQLLQCFIYAPRTSSSNWMDQQQITTLLADDAIRYQFRTEATNRGAAGESTITGQACNWSVKECL